MGLVCVCDIVNDRLFLLFTHPVDVIFVEVFEVPVMHGHIIYLETSLHEILRSSPSSFVIVKEGTNGGYLPVIEIANAPCHITHGVHHKTMVDNFFFH